MTGWLPEPNGAGPEGCSALRRLGAWAWGAVWPILASLGAVAFAGQAGAPEGRIREAATRVERAAAPLGEAAAAARLAAGFRVSPQAVTDLRDQKLDLGEIAVVLVLAATW